MAQDELKNYGMATGYCCYTHRVCFRTRMELQDHYRSQHHNQEDLAELLADGAQRHVKLYYVIKEGSTTP